MQGGGGGMSGSDVCAERKRGVEGRKERGEVEK